VANAAASAPRPDPLSYQTQRAIILQAADRDVIAILRQAQRDIIAMLNELQSRPSGIGRDIREAQLRLVQRNLHRELGKAWRQIGDVVEARRAEAAARAIGYAEQVNKFALLAGGVHDAADIANKIAESELDNAASGIDRMIARTTGASYVPLKDRVYNSDVNVGSQVDRLVNSALTRGLSAVEFAKEVRQFVNPLTPGGVRYAAMRLARTEINNAAHAASVESVRETPWVEKMEWRLSGSHGRADICDRYAKGGANNDGHYPKTAVPAKPHPQCLCYVIPVTVTDDEFEDALLSGKYNSYLERYRDLQPGQIVRSGAGGGFRSPGKALAPKPAKPPGAKPPSHAAPPTPGATAANTPFEQTHVDFATTSIKNGGSQADTVKALQQQFGISQNEAFKITLQAQKQAGAIRTASAPVVPKPAPVGRTASSGFRVSTPDPDLLRAKIKFSGQDADSISKELQRQADLAPKTARQLNSVDLANSADNLKYGVDSSALAYYVPGEQRIFLQREIFTQRYLNTTYQREISANWCTRSGPGVGGDQATFAHEFGHHVSTMLSRLPIQERAAFWRSLADDLGVPRPYSFDGGYLESWGARNKVAIQSKVSKYGSSHHEEMLAEIWQEYSTAGPGARGWIKSIGERMKELAERGAA
jgi:hypothetical protein